MISNPKITYSEKLSTEGGDGLKTPSLDVGTCQKIYFHYPCLKRLLEPVFPKHNGVGCGRGWHMRSSLQAAITELHRLHTLTERKRFLTDCEGQKSKTKAPGDSGFRGASFLDWWVSVITLCLHLAFPWCALRKGARGMRYRQTY